MSQPPQPPPPGTVLNGYQWDGHQWVPLPQVGQVVNGHRWDGRQWVPLPPQPAPTPQPVQPQQTPAQPGSAHDWILTELGKLAQAWQFEWRQQGEEVTLSRVVAEQKAFMAVGKLTYEARVYIDDARREVQFRELLKESRSGMSSGADDDFGPSGFGVQRTSYDTARDTVQDSIDEQAARYRTQYPLDFRYDAVSPQVRGIAETAGYRFSYGGLS